MIHVVHSANRGIYADQLKEMHRLRWQYYIEERAWSGLAREQREPGFEYDEYDDERAVYLLALSEHGQVQGAMRIRPTDDKSLVGDHFGDLISPDVGFKFSSDVWEITRLMRAPEYRGSDGELRLRINCAACEFALSRRIRRFVAVIDTYLLPAIRKLNRDKHRVLGLPMEYAEGEMIAVEFTPDTEWLEMVRKLAGLRHAVALELPPPMPARNVSLMQEAVLAEQLRTLSSESAASLTAWLTAQAQPQTQAVM